MSIEDEPALNYSKKAQYVLKRFHTLIDLFNKIVGIFGVLESSLAL